MFRCYLTHAINSAPPSSTRSLSISLTDRLYVFACSICVSVFILCVNVHTEK